MTTKSTACAGLISDSSDYFINNRVLAFNAGFIGSIHFVNITSKLSYSENYGTFGRSSYGYSLGTHHSPSKSLFKQVGQFSAYLEGERKLKSGITVGAAAALDNGQLLQNSFRIIGKVSKAFYGAIITPML